MKNIKIIILLICSSIWMGTAVFGQNTSLVTGNVQDEAGEPIIGVSVILSDSKGGTITDLDGNFSLNVKIGDMLKFTYLGYETLQHKVTSMSPIHVVMKEDVLIMDEVVVVGYGVQKKSDLTASIASIKPEDMISTAGSSIDQGIQGRASGVVVLNTSGQPGGATSIRIRGTSSINGTNEPLYVVDGIPIISDASVSSTGALKNPANNALSIINPNDIASIEVLKDASATSIYGARGANGVILITTKQGKKGKPTVAFNFKYGIQQLSKKMDMLNSVQLAALGNEAADNDQVDRNEVYAPYNNIAKINTDWQDEIFRTAPLQSYDVSVSGGSETNNYFVSGNIFKQDGIIVGSDFNKGTLRINFDQALSKYVKMGLTSNTTYSTSNGVVTNSEGAFASSVTSWALEMNPGLPVRDDNGKYTYENNTSRTSNVGNPLQDAREAVNKTKSFSTLINSYLEIRPMKDLIIKSTFGIDYFSLKDQAFAAPELKRAESVSGYANIGNRDGYTWLTEHTATYMKTFNEKHSLNVLAGFTAQAFQSEYSTISVAKFEDATGGIDAIQEAALKQMAISGRDEWQMLSYLARVNYSYDNRYLLTLTGRIDGSSKFGKNNKYGTFPSAAFAWRASEENFLKENQHISNLKVRTSYGIVGNQGIPSYSSLGLLYSTEAYFGDSEIVKGKVPYTRDNQNLKWETTAQFDVGLDLGLFNNRIAFGFDYYHKKTKDLLLSVPFLMHSGYDRGMQNIGDMENTGYEFTLNMLPLNSSKLTWSSDFMIGFNKNKVTNLSGATENLSGEEILGKKYWTTITVGKPIGTLYGYKTDGIIQLGEDLSKVASFAGETLQAGDRKYINKDGSGTLTEADLFELGNANPDFTYGFTNTFRYNLSDNSSLSLSVFLQGAHGNEIVNFNKFALESFDGTRNNSNVALKRWTVDNPTNDYPRATMKTRQTIISDHVVEDGSYLRLKNITLGYDLPKKLSKKLFTESISFYVSLQNIYTFTDYSGYDPEVSRFANNNLSMGADYGAYPMAKSYEFGARVTF